MGDKGLCHIKQVIENSGQPLQPEQTSQKLKLANPYPVRKKCGKPAAIWSDENEAIQAFRELFTKTGVNTKKKKEAKKKKVIVIIINLKKSTLFRQVQLLNIDYWILNIDYWLPLLPAADWKTS